MPMPFILSHEAQHVTELQCLWASSRVQRRGVERSSSLGLDVGCGCWQPTWKEVKWKDILTTAVFFLSQIWSLDVKLTRSAFPVSKFNPKRTNKYMGVWTFLWGLPFSFSGQRCVERMFIGSLESFLIKVLPQELAQRLQSAESDNWVERVLWS